MVTTVFVLTVLVLVLKISRQVVGLRKDLRK